MQVEEMKADWVIMNPEVGMDMVQVSFQLPREVPSTLRQDPKGFAREMRVAAAVKWYETGAVSQEKAAEIAGLARAEFINALNQFKVTPFQYEADEIVSETGRR